MYERHHYRAPLRKLSKVRAMVHDARVAQSIVLTQVRVIHDAKANKALAALEACLRYIPLKRVVWMLYRDSCQRCSTLGPGTVISRACLTASCKNWMMLREDYPNLRQITMHFPPSRDAASYLLKTAEVLSGLSHVQSKNPRNFHSRRKDASHIACHGAARFLVL